MLSCFFHGLASDFPCSIASARQSRRRVSRGRITSSIKPRLAATNEIVAPMLDEHVPLLEGIGVEQQLEPLARGELATAVLGLDAAGAAARPRRRPFFSRRPRVSSTASR